LKLATINVHVIAAIREIKVISYSGPGAGMPDIDGQHMCFEKDLIPGVRIRGTKQSTINSRTLEGFDVLLLPGGSLYYTEMDQDAIRSFVKNGGGYYGTCAGAYAGCTTVGAHKVTGQIDPWNASNKVASIGVGLDGLPIYPDQAGMGLSSARCEFWYQSGRTENALTTEGKTTFPNQESVVAIDHNNGPAMDANSATILATFQGDERSGAASIVADTYGAGKVILVSPHPEHQYLQNCDIISYMALYAAGGSSPSPSPSPTPSPAHCHAISAVVTDDWCELNCAQGFCPQDLCADCGAVIAI